MSDSELTVVATQTFQAPILIEPAGPSTRKKFFEFFTVPIRNANTRAAYYRAIQQFLSWCERAGYQDLEDIEPITVAAYIETLQRLPAPPTVKQHMAAIRMLFSWLTEKGVLAMNPAREVKTERFSRTEGFDISYRPTDPPALQKHRRLRSVPEIPAPNIRHHGAFTPWPRIRLILKSDLG